MYVECAKRRSLGNWVINDNEDIAWPEAVCSLKTLFELWIRERVDIEKLEFFLRIWELKATDERHVLLTVFRSMWFGNS